MVAYDMAIHKSHQIMCNAELLAFGPIFDEGKKRVEQYTKKAPVERPTQAVWKLKVEKLQFQAPGQNARKRLG